MRFAWLVLLMLWPFAVSGKTRRDVDDRGAWQAARNDSVVVEVGGSAHTFTGAELRALPQDTVRARAHEGPMQAFVGPSLAAVLAKQGARLDSLRGRALAPYVLVEARDGYRVVFGVAELSRSLAGRRVILAHLADGKALDTAMGPWRVIAEGESPTRAMDPAGECHPAAARAPVSAHCSRGSTAGS
ncbi:MAG TPA: hypothetical protein VLE53_04770 [Gemmatimonadaceae bacterium]|nr:hypothetical protein [Gemmatimonadaceae bacterium]